MKSRSFWSKVYVGATVLVGAALAVAAFAHWTTDQSVRLCLYLCAALLASRIRVKLPGIEGTMSVNFAFTLIGIVDLGLAQVLLVTWAGILGQVVHRSKLWSTVQVSFNLASITIAVTSAFAIYHSTTIRAIHSSLPFTLLLSSATLFVINTSSVSGIISLTGSKSPWQVWRENFSWTASHYLLGAGMAAVFHTGERTLGKEAVLLIAPVIYLVYRSYSAHIDQLEEAKLHTRELGELHWRTIEALALAIDAKDETTHNHLLRVKVYATEVGKELQLNEVEMQALQAAALLHDIGKLAVPEYIISKPGKLTPEEFEKMKVHPVVGAEILDRVRFPYPVVPIVKYHHEKWNGMGYPSGLKGEEIPIGARILAAVDCLDALASDRQYRKALSLDKAMEIVSKESGISFDPKVVEILMRRHVELEHMATSLPAENETKLSTHVKFELGEAPASGFESSNESGAVQIDFMVSIAAARLEFQNLLKLTTEIEGLLSVEDIGSLLATRVKRMVPHDTIVLYIASGEKLVPTYVGGEDTGYFTDLTIQMGQGLSGWVAENRLPIMNGNPTVENAGAQGPTKITKLRSALSVPLECRGVILGALTLYSSQADYYTRDALRILEAVCVKASVTIASALEHERVAVSAVTDALTGLPNARSLFTQFAEELKIAAAQQSTLAVIVIDINNFKHINDSFGHLTGNRILQRLGTGLKENSRNSDYAARLGGDEFVIIIPHGGADAVFQKTHALNTMASRIKEICGAPTLSIGAAFYPEDGEDVEALLEAADGRMYENKGHHHERRFSAELLNASHLGADPLALELKIMQQV